MADDKGGGGGGSDLWWILGIIVLLVVMWFGASAQKQNSGKFFQSPLTLPSIPTPPVAGRPTTPINQGVAGSGSVSRPTPNSPYAGQIRIEAGNAQWETEPDKEYLTLIASVNNYLPIDLSGWNLTNGRNLKRNLAGQNFAADRVVLPAGLSLNPDERAIITTGRGPQLLFHVNKCAGYFNQDWDSTPSLHSFNSNSCPLAENHPLFESFNNNCQDFLRTVPRCVSPYGDYKGERREELDQQSSKCRDFVKSYLTYKGCVATYKDDPDFYQSEWRVYSRFTRQLWSGEDERITLYDKVGLTVDILEY